MDDSTENFDWQTPEQRQAQVKQAIDLRDQASRGGLEFSAYLVPKIAEQVLDDVAKGYFRDPSEFVFVASRVFLELEQHPDLRKELLRRQIQAGIDSGVRESSEKVFEELKTKMAEWHKQKPAIWQEPVKQDS